MDTVLYTLMGNSGAMFPDQDAHGVMFQPESVEVPHTEYYHVGEQLRGYNEGREMSITAPECQFYPQTPAFETPYYYAECHGESRSQSEVTTHSGIHTEEAPLAWKESEGYFVEQNRLTEAQLINIDQRPYSWTEGPQDFRQTWDLQSHLQTPTDHNLFAYGPEITQIQHHDRERTHNIGNGEESSMTAHESEYHSRVYGEEGKYPCDMCARTFDSAFGLKIHLRVHPQRVIPKRPLQCSFCRKPYSTLSNLYRHQRLHMNEKLYSCTESSRGSRDTHDPQARSRTPPQNEGKALGCDIFERKYPCTVCDRTFRSALGLTLHSRKHPQRSVPKGPLLCNSCGKTFRHLSNLRRHERLHTFEKAHS